MTSKQDGNDAPARTSAGSPASPAAPSQASIEAATDPFERVLEMVRFLRIHCPWDRAQTPRSLLPYLLEEAQEVALHVEDGDDDALATELGDLLLHVAFQAALAEERGAFAAHDPAGRVLDKMRRRHPHLFGLGEARDWEELKAEERTRDAQAAAHGASPGAFSHLDNLPRDIDPLARAHRIQDRVASVGFDWDDASGAFAKVREEVEEVDELAGTSDRAALEEEIGDLLFAVVNLARHLDVEPETALRRTNLKFRNRFAHIEQSLKERGESFEDTSLSEMDKLWNEAKSSLRP